MTDWFSRMSGSLKSFTKTNVPPLGRAFREVAVNAAVGLMPVWAGAFLTIFFTNLHFKEALYSNISRGDLFIGATAAVAPVALYMTAKSKGLPPKLNWEFPFALYYILAINFLFGACIILFTMKRLHDIGITNTQLNEDRFTTFSAVSFVFSILLAFAVTFTRQKLDELDFSAVTEGNILQAKAAWKNRSRDDD